MVLILIIFWNYQSVKNYKIENKNKSDLESKYRYYEYVRDSEKYWIDTEKMFMDNYPYLAALYSEIYNIKINLPTLSDQQKIEQEFKERNACAVLFQIIENIVSSKNSQDIFFKYAWFRVFLSWSKSPKFIKYWKESSQFYQDKAQNFINGLIEGKMITIQDTINFVNNN